MKQVILAFAIYLDGTDSIIHILENLYNSIERYTLTMVLLLFNNSMCHEKYRCTLQLLINKVGDLKSHK